MSLKRDIIEFANTLGNIRIDSPFEKFPNYVVLRHKDTNKWFGLIMTVEKRKLGIDDNEILDIIDIKADPEIITILTESSGYFPAYHMNKNHWITIVLDGSIEEKQIRKLVKDSYILTSE